MRDPVGEKTLQIISTANDFNEWMFHSIKPYIHGNILEIGSGIGNISKFFIAEGYLITLSDYNQEYCLSLSSKYSHLPNVEEVITLDLQNPNFEKDYIDYKSKFESIYLLNVIEHLQDDKLGMLICKYFLKPGGSVITLAPSYDFLYCNLDKQLGHYRRYTAKKLSSVMEAVDLKVVSTKYFNLLGTLGWLLFGKFLNNDSLEKNKMSLFNKLVPAAKILDKMVFNKIGLSIIVAGKKIK
jgi:2-polyprenyl-3-methyl-5-hydroxy-6-metoxy-1,4-benzoquinol methylase